MDHIEIHWDLDDDPDGNVEHLAEHGVSKDEFEEILSDHRGRATVSNSSGQPIAFGWTSTGRYLGIVWEEITRDPLAVYPITAFDAPPPMRGGRG